jgi:predicted negative regulator of RcsB-dependent stress response
MREGVRIWDLTGAALIRPFLLCLLAGGLTRAERYDEALETLDATVEHAARTGEIWYRPEMYRLRGDVLAAAGAEHQAIRTCYQDALDDARRIGAVSLERRASASLAQIPKGGKH